MGWHCLVNSSSDSPTSLARICDMAFEILESGTLEQSTGGKVQEPGADDTATPPQLSDLCNVEIVHIVLWVAQGCRFSINFLLVYANISVTQDIQSLSIRRHDTVFNTIMHHFD